MSVRVEQLYNLVCCAHISMHVSDFAARFGVSSRTIYNDVNRINTFLRAYNRTYIQNKRGILSYEYLSTVAFSQLVNDRELFYIDPEFRRTRIGELILTLSDGFSIEDLQAYYDISRNTLLHDIQYIKNILQKYSIKLTSFQFVGYVVEGSEKDIRNALTSFFLNDEFLFYKSNTVFEDCLNKSNDSACNISEVEESTSLSTLDFSVKMHELIEKICKDLQVEFSDASVDYLICSAYASYCRIRINKKIVLASQVIPTTREFEMVKKYSKTLEQIFSAELSADELDYVASKLREASIVHFDDLVSENWIKLGILIDKLIEDVSHAFPYAGFIDDEMLRVGLLNHLRPAYWRAVNQTFIENPMLDYVANQCTELFDVVEASLKIVESELDVHFPIEEVAFFTLFFAGSLERNKRAAIRQTSVIVVCREGLATSQLIRSKLETNFDINIIGVYGVAEARRWLESNNVDVIVSVGHFSFSGENVIEVSPQFNQVDFRKLQESFHSQTKPVDVAEIMSIILRHASLEEDKKKLLISDLKQYFGLSSKCLENCKLERGGYQPMLHEVLTKDLVEVNYEAADRNDAVRRAGRLLVKRGIAEESYIEAMIENVEVNGTYIVIAPGIAMPHARPDKGAKSIGFGIITLRHPVIFGHPTNDPVEIVIALCAIDHQTHLKALAELAEILADETKVKQIKLANTPGEIIKIMEGSE
ncbi:BglG family transcription antiterminator [Atopobium fossor]|uniref:BglG family transcription antiterminator n=1 Tax=Atopobium fossor TaxID=39487 RepID=UPI0004069939|nr:BglG family transcription antiterminator [Atopobium fossor]